MSATDELDISGVPLDKVVEDDEFPNDEKVRTFHQAAKKVIMRRRASSVFNIQDYVSLRNEKTNEQALKGKCVMSHADSPKKRIVFGGNLYYPQLNNDGEIKTSGNNNNNINNNNNNNTDDSCTYQLEPVIMIDCAKVNTIISEEFEKVRNLPAVSQRIICLRLANDIKKRVKLLGFKRYKYIVLATMGDEKQQGLRMASRFFWDDKRDSYVSQSLKINDYFIVVVVYAVYSL